MRQPDSLHHGPALPRCTAPRHHWFSRCDGRWNPEPGLPAFHSEGWQGQPGEHQGQVIVTMDMRVMVMVLVARTNPTAKQLHCVMVRGTAVDVTGCIILLQFCPKLTKVKFHRLHLDKDSITLLRVGGGSSMRVLETQFTRSTRSSKSTTLS